MITIAIDPDIRLSGIAIVDNNHGGSVLHASAESFADTLKLIRRAADEVGELTVVMEDTGTDAVFHLPPRAKPSVAAKMGVAIGRNRQVADDICSVLIADGINVRRVKPLRKIWRGADKKISRKELAAITGYDARVNQDVRDAVLLAWAYSGLNIRINERTIWQDGEND